VIDGCDKKFLNYFAKSERYYDTFDLYDKESLEFPIESTAKSYAAFFLQYKAIQKLKITNSEDFDLEYLPCITSLQELEIDCNVIRINSYGYSWNRMGKIKRMYKLKKITLSSRENCLYTDPGKAVLLAIPHIQYIKINEVISWPCFSSLLGKKRTEK